MRGHSIKNCSVKCKAGIGLGVEEKRIFSAFPRPWPKLSSMTIWLLTLVLLASLAALGYRQGAIRVGISFVGILVAAGLAPVLGRLLRPLLMAVGLKDPVMAWALGPLIVFIVISALFKVAALMVHQKVDVYYKYHAG